MPMKAKPTMRKMQKNKNRDNKDTGKYKYKIRTLLPASILCAALCAGLCTPLTVRAQEGTAPEDMIQDAAAPEDALPEDDLQAADSPANAPQDDAVPEETPDPYPPSYYLPIESNEIPGWPQGPQVQAESAIVMDVDYGICLYEKNIHAKQYPASITKIMTALVTIENSDLSDVVTFSENAVYGIEPESSHIGIDVGEQLTVEQSLYALMLASANEVAMGLAEHVAGSVEAFVDMMNEKAAELGCTETHFVNPHGLHDEDHYVTAHDMALIARAAYHNPTFLNTVCTVYYEIPPTNMEEETRYLLNHQKLLSDDDWYYTGCRGGKTGYTDQALNTLVTFAKKDNRILVCVDLKTDGTPIYSDTTALLDYGFDNFQWKQTKKEADVAFRLPLDRQLGPDLPLSWADACGLKALFPGWTLLPADISAKDLTTKKAMEPNTAGPWRLKTSYYYKDHYVGYSYQYAS